MSVTYQFESLEAMAQYFSTKAREADNMSKRKGVAYNACQLFRREAATYTACAAAIRASVITSDMPPYDAEDVNGWHSDISKWAQLQIKR